MEFIQDREVFIKESASNNYPVHAYYLSKLLLEFPLMMVLPLLENLLTYFIIGYKPSLYCFCQFQLVYWLTVQVGTSIGYFISALSDNQATAAQITPFAVMPFVLFGGFVVNVKAMPAHIRWF